MISDSETVARTREGRVAVPEEFALRAVTDNLEFAIERAFLERMA